MNYIKQLTGELQASSKGETIADPYCAYLAEKEGKALIVITKTRFGVPSGACGSWYLSTLLEGEGIADGLSIDYGQQWQIDSGMRAVIFEAAIYCADNFGETS